MHSLRIGAWAAALGLATALPAAAERTFPDDVPGSGCLRTRVDGSLVDFPLKHTKVDADVSGPVARVLVTQTFQNPYAETIEAVYVFPLPHDAAVCDFEMRVGNRTIRGEIERRGDARRIYDEARAQGHVASLLEQQRPNVFTQSVANILPGNEIDVTITYVETLPYEKDAWELVFPTVVGPRYNPSGEPPETVTASGDWRAFRRPPSPDPDHLENPPFLTPGVRSGHDLEVSVRWDAGIPIEEIGSPTHRVDVRTDGARRAFVSLHPLDSVPNKDFVVRCRAKGRRPEAGVLAYHDGRDGYLSVLVHPKVDLSGADVTPKEMIFVLDCSGSMSGEPIAAAKALVRHALTNVDPRDTFQIIRFSENASGFAARPVPATASNVKRGLAYVDQLAGEGGTQMIEGIRAALGVSEDRSRLRIVMFLTDGYIGNEAEILSEVRARIGDARLFSFGVGSSVNRYLLDELAREGRGEVRYFLPGSAVRDEVATFYERIRHPYLTDVELVWHGLDVEDALPARVPDLFGGRPLCVQARYAGSGNGSLEIRGRIAGRPWNTRVPLDLPRRESGNPAIGVLWARARIADLERQDLHGTDSGVENEITQLGLAHRLVTKYTSFVAVEDRIVVSNGRPTRVTVPVEMPESVSYEGVFGEPTAPMAGHAGRASFRTLSPPTAKVEDAQRPSPGGAFGSLDRPKTVEPPSSQPTEGFEMRSDGTKSAGPPARSGRLDVTLGAERTALRAGEPLTLTVTLVNRGGSTVEVPATLALGDGVLRIRIVDSAWNETVLGPLAGPPKPVVTAMKPLKAGETRRFTIRLTAAEAPFLRKPGVYHLFVQGGPLGIAGDSERITIRVAA